MSSLSKRPPKRPRHRSQLWLDLLSSSLLGNGGRILSCFGGGLGGSLHGGSLSTATEELAAEPVKETEVVEPVPEQTAEAGKESAVVSRSLLSHLLGGLRNDFLLGLGSLVSRLHSSCLCSNLWVEESKPAEEPMTEKAVQEPVMEAKAENSADTTTTPRPLPP
jgi:hypothetical protein